MEQIYKPSLSELSVLLIEDDLETREILGFFLKELGIPDIHALSNAMDALKFMKDNQDWRGLIICDWNMPHMSGASFYRQVKNSNPSIPFVMVTGRNDEDSVQFAKESGIYAYILKPVSIEELKSKIEKVAFNHAQYLGSAGIVHNRHYNI
jgi:CheY-like chemotaxis protein